jgi:subtilase family serine protease
VLLIPLVLLAPATVTADAGGRAMTPPAPGAGLTSLAGQVPPVVASGSAVDLGPHDPGAVLSINLGLPLHNQAQLEAAIATQASRGSYLTRQQFIATYAPTAAQVRSVTSWAAGQGLRITSVSPDGLIIIAEASVRTIAAALRVRIDDYRGPDGILFFSADRDATVPADLGLQTISGLSNYHRFHTMLAPQPGYRGRSGSPPSAVQMGYVPADLRSLYDVDPHGYDGTGQPIDLILWGDPITNTDFAQFAAHSGDPSLSAGTGPDHITWQRAGPASTCPTNPDLQQEVALDSEYAHGMALHSHLTYWLAGRQVITTTGGTTCAPPEAWLLQAIDDAVLDTSTHIVSNSWGGTAITTTTDAWFMATNNLFEFAAAVGTTFYFASGDEGPSSGCLGAWDCTLPSYPADNRYVVAVGGTTLVNNPTRAEIAWSGSGGGCTAVFPRPPWQGGIASSCSGRAVPDLAADADPQTGAYVYYSFEDEPIPGVVGGTSLATPLIAGMAAVTDRYLALNYPQTGQRGQGWLPPRLYQLGNSPEYPSYFHDVTLGYSVYPLQFVQGFFAGQRWDQVTGWGAPDWYQYTQGLACTLRVWPASSCSAPARRPPARPARRARPPRPPLPPRHSRPPLPALRRRPPPTCRGRRTISSPPMPGA